MRDLKQLSKDPNAAERARRAERKADEKAGLLVVENKAPAPADRGGGAGPGFKKGGFKSSFASITGPSRQKPVKNVLGDDEDETTENNTRDESAAVPEEKKVPKDPQTTSKDGQSEENTDTDEEELISASQADGGYYDPFNPTGCSSSCPGRASAAAR